MAPSRCSPLSTSSSFPFLHPLQPFVWDIFTLLSEGECLSCISFLQLWRQTHECVSKPAWLAAHGYSRLETKSVFLYFLPRRSLKSPAEYVCVHLEVRKAQYQCWHKGPVPGSAVGRGWAARPCWILGLHYAFMFSLRCYVLSPGQLGHIFNGPFGWKTV